MSLPLPEAGSTEPQPQTAHADDRLREDPQQHLVREFLESVTPHTGFFVDVGANHPFAGSQSWHLERRGWRGVLVEPLPQQAELLRRTRQAAVFAVACSSPANAGKVLPFYADGPLSGLDRRQIAPFANPVAIEVPVRTLDAILEEAGAPQPIDFLSIDVEGHEIEALSGFDFARWAPRLILMEDHLNNLNRHRFLVRHGYRLVRRTELNGWYVPQASPVRFGLAERWQLTRKYYLGLPLRKLRIRWRRLVNDRSRQPHAPE